jgi:hypothetical protein
MSLVFLFSAVPFEFQSRGRIHNKCLSLNLRLLSIIVPHFTTLPIKATYSFISHSRAIHTARVTGTLKSVPVSEAEILEQNVPVQLYANVPYHGSNLKYLKAKEA